MYVRLVFVLWFLRNRFVVLICNVGLLVILWLEVSIILVMIVIVGNVLLLRLLSLGILPVLVNVWDRLVSKDFLLLQVLLRDVMEGRTFWVNLVNVVLRLLRLQDIVQVIVMHWNRLVLQVGWRELKVFLSISLRL